MDNEMDIAAQTLCDMSNDAAWAKVLIQLSDSSNSQLADHGKPKEKCGNNGLKIRIRLSKASSTEIEQMKKEKKNDSNGKDTNNNGLFGAVPSKISNEYDNSENKSFANPELLTKTKDVGNHGKKVVFSFSIRHLLSAVRAALIAGHDKENELPSLTIHEILERVRSTPGDPNILTTKESLLDLIRECLRQISSRTPPKGAVCWEPLVGFNKNSRSWTWIGPIPIILPHEDNKVRTSSKSWGIPRNNISKLVKQFSDWLKSSQETLVQIASLPPPPSILLEPIYTMQERFKGIIRVNSACTLNPSPVQVRDYFHKEEALRYKMPERAFSYTALDGRKSTVGPLVKSSGRPSNKVREHSMLKYHRPPSFTVVCLVRDAASRLPGRIGTKADICLLVKDSQFIEENVCEMELARVVSSAMERLRHERDPCIRFNRKRNLWVYLHGDREDEDFDHESEALSKKMKRDQEVMDIDRA